MPRARRFTLDLKVDDRTSHMSNQALVCRSRGHLWEEEVSITRRRFLQLVREGLDEKRFRCGHRCGAQWRQLYRIRSGELIEDERTYPTGGEYLMPKGSGRLARSDARVAAFAREHPELV